jgi:hypothetical protein
MNSRKSNIDKNYKGNVYTTPSPRKIIGKKEKLLPLLELKSWIMPSHYND